MISILDYGIGNLGSIANMLKKINVESEIIRSSEEILEAKKIILPGVGHFGKAAECLDGYREALVQRVVLEKTPILGICLGMQLLTNGSEESPDSKGLGFIPGYTYKFVKTDSRMRIPHMGWNYTVNKPNLLTNNTPEQCKFYFVHSYFVKTLNEDHTIMKTNYGIDFASGICKDNIFGTQFHPEKSHKYGMKIFENFANY